MFDPDWKCEPTLRIVDITQLKTNVVHKAFWVQGYGMTESCGVGSATPGDAPEFADHFGSAGVLMPNLEAVVVDPISHTRMAPGQQGELWIRGPNVMKGKERQAFLLPHTVVKRKIRI